MKKLKNLNLVMKGSERIWRKLGIKLMAWNH